MNRLEEEKHSLQKITQAVAKTFKGEQDVTVRNNDAKRDWGMPKIMLR